MSSIKVYGVEFVSNLAVDVNGKRRADFSIGQKIIVTDADRLKLLRLGCKQLWEREIGFSDVAPIDDAPKAKKK